MNYLRIEIIIPFKDNDDNRFGEELHGQTFDELMDHFGGCTYDKNPLIGGWLNPNTGRKFVDENFCFWIICIDNITNTYFLNDFKEELKKRYQLDEILI